MVIKITDSSRSMTVSLIYMLRIRDEKYHKNANGRTRTSDPKIKTFVLYEIWPARLAQ